MTYCVRLISLVTLIICVALFEVHAQNYPPFSDLTINNVVNGRSSIDFKKDAKNIQHSIPAGTTAKILEVRQLKGTGSFAVRIKVKSMWDPSSSKIKVGDETWIYYSQKDPVITFQNNEGDDVQDPEMGLVELAKRSGTLEDGVMAAHLPTKEDVLREQKPIINKLTEGDLCYECSRSGDNTKKNRQEIKDVMTRLENRERPSGSPVITDPVWKRFPEVARYSSSKEVTDSIAYGMRNKENRSRRLCYRYTKRALLGGGLVDEYLPGSNAREGVAELKAKGFINMMEDPRYKSLIKSPKDAPKGAIIVYRHASQARHPGHIEIKTDWGTDGGYVSDFLSTQHDGPSGRVMIGVMMKPTGGA
ncbi:hypothetical protein ACES2L_08460 [Bdellovibrio bacteriovorus]